MVVHWKDSCWCWNSSTLAPDVKSWFTGKEPEAGKDWGQAEKGTTENEIIGWHHWINGHGFGWTLGVGDGQGGLACCGSWGHKESNTTEWLNWTELNWINWKEQTLWHSFKCFHKVFQHRHNYIRISLYQILYDGPILSQWPPQNLLW